MISAASSLAGPGPGIAMQAGLGFSDGGWSWFDATYNTDAPSAPGATDINNDEYQWTSPGLPEGIYRTAFRAQSSDAGWIYCELNGPQATLGWRDAALPGPSERVQPRQVPLPARRGQRLLNRLPELAD